MPQKPKTREEMIRDFLLVEREQAQSNRQQDGNNNPPEKVLLLEGARQDDQSSQDADDGVLIAWEGPEFETFEYDRRWYVVATVVLLLIIIYAVIVNSPIMAITFILIGAVGYIYLQKDPRHLTFAVTYQGVVVGDELYSFDQIESFWIFYEPPHTYLFTLTMKRGGLMPYIHIPLHQVDPVALREVMMDFVPEERRELTAIDTLERLLHI